MAQGSYSGYSEAQGMGTEGSLSLVEILEMKDEYIYLITMTANILKTG